MAYIDPNDKRLKNQLGAPTNPNAMVQPYRTASAASLTAGNAAIANDPTIQKGPTVGSKYNTSGADNYINSQISATNPVAQPSIEQQISNIKPDNRGFMDTLAASPVAKYFTGETTPYVAPTITPAIMQNFTNGQREIFAGGLSKAAGAGQPAAPQTPQLQMNGLNLPNFDYTKFRPQGVDVQGLAGQARDFGGQIDLSQFNNQLNGNLQQNGSREDNFNAQINDIMGQLAQSKDDISKHIGSIGSAGSFSGILQAKLLAKDATARRSQLQGALAAILQQRVGANDANKNNLQSIGLNATNAQATNAADFTQSLGKNILNDGIQKDINNNATQNDVAKTVANEQFSSDAKSKQFDLAQKQRMEATRLAYANAKPGSPESEQLARQMAIEAGGTGIVEPNIMKVGTLARDKDGNVIGTTDKLISIGKNRNTGGVDARTVYDSDREAVLQQAADRIATLQRLDESEGLDKKGKAELSYFRQMIIPK